jgi:hypothetical protein
MHIDQHPVVQSSIQDEKVKSTNLGKLDGLVSQIGCSDFDRTEANVIAIKNDSST